MATTTRRTRKTTTAATPADTEPTAAAPDPADTATETTDPTATDPAPAEATETSTGDTPANAPVSGAPVSGAPVSGAPVGSGDHLKIVMVAGILGDPPAGGSASPIVDDSGLRAAIVRRELSALGTARAAARK